MERWGAGTGLHFTVRNTTAEARSYSLTIDAAAAGLTAEIATPFTEAISGTSFTAAANGADLVLSDNLPAQGVRLFRFKP